MKYLVPVDISDIASNALDYAVGISHKKDKITVIHVWNDMIYPIQGEVGYVNVMSETDILNKVEILVDVANIPEGGPDIEIIMAKGEPVNALTEEANSGSYDAIIMGTRDKYDIFDKIFGTISLGMVKKSIVPVYLIPRGAKFHKPKSIIIGTDHHFQSDELIEKVINWNDSFKSSLAFYHINNKRIEDHQTRRKLMGELLDKRNLPYAISYNELHSNDVSSTLINKSIDGKHDLIMIATESQSWLETVLTRSVTKDLILKATIPMLFFHANPLKKKAKDSEEINITAQTK